MTVGAVYFDGRGKAGHVFTVRRGDLVEHHRHYSAEQAEAARAKLLDGNEATG
jgi:hypothetical protein